MSIVNQAEEKIFEEEARYRERKGRKWIALIFGAIGFGLIGYFIMRLGIDNFLKNIIIEFAQKQLLNC